MKAMRWKEDLYARLKAVEHAVLTSPSDENNYFPSNYEAAHDMGRWWEAALLLQATIGTEIPETTNSRMSANVRALTNHPYGLLLNDELLGGGCLNYHNLREALLTYTAFIEFRSSYWAKNCAEKLLDTINRRFFEKTLTDDEICAAVGVVVSSDTMITRPIKDIYRDEDDTPTTGRAIEGMYRYWLATHSPLALEVMRKAVAFHREHTICTDGSTPAWIKDSFHTGHNHSYLGTIRGLLLYAVEFEDEALIRAIYLTYKNSVFKYNCDETGFAPHDLALARFPDQHGDPLGDHASCADIIYIAFLLATRCGYPELLDDAEKLMRCRLFYCQSTSDTFLGAWGIFGGSYFGEGYTLDVYALITSTLCYIYKSMIEEKDDRMEIHLHFSKETAAVTVESDRDERQSTKITPHVQKQIWVHIPSWCPLERVTVTNEDGAAVPYTKAGEYLIIPEKDAVPGKTLAVSYELPVGETTVKTWKSGKTFRCSWKGDTLVHTEEI